MSPRGSGILAAATAMRLRLLVFCCLVWPSLRAGCLAFCVCLAFLSFPGQLTVFRAGCSGIFCLPGGPSRPIWAKARVGRGARGPRRLRFSRSGYNKVKELLRTSQGGDLSSTRGTAWVLVGAFVLFGPRRLDSWPRRPGSGRGARVPGAGLGRGALPSGPGCPQGGGLGALLGLLGVFPGAFPRVRNQNE